MNDPRGTLLIPTALTTHESLGTEAPSFQAGSDQVLDGGLDSETRLMCGRASRDQTPFDPRAQHSCAGSIASRMAVEPSVGASCECAASPAGYSKCISQPADAAGADNHRRITGAALTAPALSFPIHATRNTQHVSLFGPLSMDLATVTPVQNVSAYLKTRKPVAHYEHELSLYLTLGDDQRNEIETLFAAFDLVATYVDGDLSVQRACQSVHSAFAQNPPESRLRGSWKTFRGDFDLWKSKRDWVCMVNHAKAGAAWQDRDDGLPADFLAFAEKRISRYAREDGQQKALESIHRQWRTGRNPDGEQEPIPGYGTRPTTLNGRPVTAGYWQDWFQAIGHKQFGMERRPLPDECPGLPRGWDFSNIRRQLKARGIWTTPVKLLIQQGVSAAKEFLPYNLRTRRDLRFLEEITFDDVRTDWVIRDTKTGAVCELWLLIARDTATAMALGFVMHLSVMREDGSKPHLGLKEMKQLAAWLLERYPLPPYESHWVIERGTATLSEGSAKMLAEMLPRGNGDSPQITLHYTSMIGGKSPAGYQEKKTGCSRGKASHESNHRPLHTASSYIPGQTGSRWDIRPADLNARAAECVEYWKLSQRLPEHLRGRVQYSLLDWTQAKEHLFRILLEQNFRDHHALEGFDRVVEWLDQQTGKWLPQNTYPVSRNTQHATPIPTRTRMEMPVERAIKLMAPYAGQWKKVSPDIIIAFLSHTARTISRKMIKPSGEIIFTYEKKPIIFAPPTGLQSAICNLPSALGYYAPEDPRFLHVTNGKGAVLGTWYRRDRNGRHDQELIEQSMRYTANALKAAQKFANGITTDARAEIESIRANNKDLAAQAGLIDGIPPVIELDRGNEYNDVVAPQVPALKSEISNLQSPVAAALVSLPSARAALKAEKQQQAEEGRAAAEDLLAALSANTRDDSES